MTARTTTLRPPVRGSRYAFATRRFLTALLLSLSSSYRGPIHVVRTARALTATPTTPTTTTLRPGGRRRRRRPSVAIVGGGPSGVFAAATIVEKLRERGAGGVLNDDGDDEPVVTVFESSSSLLPGLRRSSSSSTFVLAEDPQASSYGSTRELLEHGYPRGRRELASLMSSKTTTEKKKKGSGGGGAFPPAAQREWFDRRGVASTTLPDGDVVADRDAVRSALEDSLPPDVVRARLRTEVTRVERVVAPNDDDASTTTTFRATYRETSSDDAATSERSRLYDCVVLATGTSERGLDVARSLGHSVRAPIPSLFGFSRRRSEDDDDDDDDERFPAQDALFEGLDSVATTVTAPHCRVSYKIKVPGQKRPRVHKAVGPVTFGVRDDGDGDVRYFVSGKAPRRLSSFAAEDLCGDGGTNNATTGTLLVHFCPEIGRVEEVYERLWRHRREHPDDVLASRCPLEHRRVDYDDYDFETDSFAAVVEDCVPPALWSGLCRAATDDDDDTIAWGRLSPRKVRAIADLVVACPFAFRERWYDDDDEGPRAAAGGVALREVDASRATSKIVVDDDGDDALFLLCGSVLDANGSSVGCDRMIDWATGRVAGERAAAHVLSRTERAIDDDDDHHHD